MMKKNDQQVVLKCFHEVSHSKHISKAEIIAETNVYMPGFNIGSTPIDLLIGDIDVVAIIYTIIGVDGKPTVASGVIAYSHLLGIRYGTLAMEEVLSKQFNIKMTPVIGRHIVVMADNLGILEPD